MHDVQSLSNEYLKAVQDAGIDRYLLTKRTNLPGHPRIQCFQPLGLGGLEPFQNDAQGYGRRSEIPTISQPHDPGRSFRLEQEKIIQQCGSLAIDLSHVCQCECSEGLSFPLDIVCQRITLRLFTAEDVIELLEGCHDVRHRSWYP